jgi:hypothetical protein
MKPVHNRHLSTNAVQTKPGSTRPFNTVFPVVHTPYNYCKEFIR